MTYRRELWKREVDHEADGTAEVRLEVEVDGHETVHVTYELFSTMLAQLGWDKVDET